MKTPPKPFAGVEPNDVARFLEVEAPTLVETGFTQFTLEYNGPTCDVTTGAEWLAWRDAVNASR